MRRTLTLLSSGLVLLGLELSTRVLTLTGARLSAGFTALANGVEFHVSAVRFSAGVAALAVGLFGLGIVAWLGQAESRVTAVGDACPACGLDTERVKRRMSHKILSSLIGHRLTRRRCGACGWTGLSVRY